MCIRDSVDSVSEDICSNVKNGFNINALIILYVAKDITCLLYTSRCV